MSTHRTNSQSPAPVLRTLIKRSGLPAVVRWILRRVRPARPAVEVFTKIYQSRTWGDGPSASGVGSSLEQTARWRAEVPALLARLGVESILDAPCGDFHWMREVAGQFANYIGGDIVPELIEDNRERYGAPGRRFEVLDIVRDPIPKVDLIHCRDCLVHLPLATAMQALANFKQSGSTYLLTTTFPKTGRKNMDISVGEWRPLDLELAPFGFPPPIWSLAEVPELSADGITHFKHIALWKLSDLPIDGAN